MLNGKQVVAVIPARGGSKSIPGKNIRPLKGKPLLAWAIEVAHQVREIDRLIVSTDDAEIAAVARLTALKFTRAHRILPPTKPWSSMLSKICFTHSSRNTGRPTWSSCSNQLVHLDRQTTCANV